MMNHELARRHRSYWNAESIHSFWFGDSFYFADVGQGLSYSLGQVLFRNLMADYRLPSFKACIPLLESQAKDAIAIIKRTQQRIATSFVFGLGLIHREC